MKKSITILFLDNSFTFGGAINSLCHLLQALDTKKFVPILVTGQPREYISRSFTCTWYHFIPKLPWINDHFYQKILTFPVSRIRFFRFFVNKLRFLYWTIFITLPEAWKYYRIGRKHHVHIIHLNNILGSQSAGILAAKLLRIPCVAHLRDFETVHPVTRFYARMIDHHVAISSAIHDNLLQLGVPEKRISLIHDAIDLAQFNEGVSADYLYSEFKLKDTSLRFGVFGRVVEWKGVREFVYATKDVVQEIPDAIAFVVGSYSDGDQAFYEEMMALAENLGLSEHIIFTGYRQDIPALMKIMDVIVHASNRPEPFGMVLIEGMAMGKPIIATRGGGPLDIVIEGETGLLVAMNDINNMGKAISSLLRQPELRGKMGNAGKKRVQSKFDCQRNAAKIECIFNSMCNKIKRD